MLYAVSPFLQAGGATLNTFYGDVPLIRASTLEKMTVLSTSNTWFC